ncbi:MAG: phosphotransferase [Trueperaceae bacterium]|nr:phosphotransferase [Trueperaceae bacterium]
MKTIRHDGAIEGATDLTIADLGAPIGQGITADVYAWTAGWVLKLFKASTPEAIVAREASKASVVHAAGVPTPSVGDLLRLDDRWGLPYERVDGPSLQPAMFQGTEAALGAVQRLADLHLALHARTVVASLGLPTYAEVLAEEIRRLGDQDAALREEVLAELNTLPGGSAICHGDFHLDNVLLAADGPKVIDWSRAGIGHPLADVASTVVLLGDLELPPLIPDRDAIEAMRPALTEAYLARYLASWKGSASDLGRWRRVVAAAWLAFGWELERERLLQIVAGS